MFDSANLHHTIMATRNIAKETVQNLGYKICSQEPLELDYKREFFEVYYHFVDWAIEAQKILDIRCRHWAPPERGRDGPRQHHCAELITMKFYLILTFV